MLVQFCFFTAYFVVSPPSGFAVRKLGYKSTILLGLGVAALGCFTFYPAASLRSYPLFLGAMFILASGFTLLQVAVNPYAAILGSKETASSRLTLAQAFNSLGTTIAPWFGANLILSSAVSGGDPTEAARSASCSPISRASACPPWPSTSPRSAVSLRTIRRPSVIRQPSAASVFSHWMVCSIICAAKRCRRKRTSTSCCTHWVGRVMAARAA